MGEKLRFIDPKWTVKGIGDAVEKIKDKEALQRRRDNPYSTVHRTKLGAQIEQRLRGVFYDTEGFDH